LLFGPDTTFSLDAQKRYVCIKEGGTWTLTCAELPLQSYRYRQNRNSREDRNGKLREREKNLKTKLNHILINLII